MKVYSSRMYAGLFILLLVTASAIAQTDIGKVNLSWDPPEGDQQNFDHYRVYQCRQELAKKDNKVTCGDGVPEQQNLKKQTKIEITPLSQEDSVYVVVTAVSESEGESDLSNQIEIAPIIPLASYHENDSGNIRDGFDIKNLWDQSTVKKPEHTTAARLGENTIWVEFDLKRPHRLQVARLFGDEQGNMLSKSWSLLYKLQKDDSWEQAFENAKAEKSEWVQKGLNWVVAQFVRVEISGDPNFDSVQARELELRGKRALTRSSDAKP